MSFFRKEISGPKATTSISTVSGAIPLMRLRRLFNVIFQSTSSEDESAKSNDCFYSAPGL